MARAGLAAPLNDAFARAVRQGAAVEIKGVTVGTKVVDVSVQPLSEPPGLRGMVLVVFVDVAPPAAPIPALDKAQKTGVHAKQAAVLSQEA